eukprot:g2623.t1
MQSVKDQLSSRMSNIQYGIVRIVFQLLLSNHIIACLWFLLGSEENPDSTWVEQMQLKSKPAEFQYTTSLYWAFSQLGVGQTEIEAVNLHERIFSIVISFLALINFSTMVSSMTSLLESLRKLKDEETEPGSTDLFPFDCQLQTSENAWSSRHRLFYCRKEQFSLLRRYLASNSIDPDLSLRITSFLQHSFSLKKKATSKDGLLLESEDYNTRRVLCKMATQLQHSVLALDDVVFSAQSMANSCFYVAEGNCSYEQQDLAPLMLCGTWAAEMCLWTPWIHTGHLVSKDISRLITLEVTSFCECISRDRGVWSLAANYAQRFVGELNEEGHWSDLSPEYLQAAYLHESVGSQNSVRRKTCRVQTQRSGAHVGFCRALLLLQSFDWHREALIVDIDGKITEEESHLPGLRQAYEKHLSTLGPKASQLCRCWVSTRLDPHGILLTSPGATLCAWLRQRASSALLACRARIFGALGDDSTEPRGGPFVAAEVTESAAQQLIQGLQQKLASVALVLYDRQRRLLALKWRPSAFFPQPQTVLMGSVPHTVIEQGDDAPLCVPNVLCILSHVSALAEGLALDLKMKALC